MHLTIFCCIIKINNFKKLYEAEMKLFRFYFSSKMMVFGTSYRLFLFIVTLCIIFHLNQALPVRSTHINTNVRCGSDMMRDTFSRIQMTPLIFKGIVLRKQRIPDSGSNWKLVALVEVQYIFKDIFTPQMLNHLQRVWIGPFTDQINITRCMSMLKNQSYYIFFGIPLQNSKNSFQSLYVPIEYSEKERSKISNLLQKKMEGLSISKIQSQNITVEGKIDVQCQASGYPTPRFYWYKNNREPILKAYYSSRISYSVQGIKSILHIEYVEKSDEANYTCQAENIYGFVTSTFKLQVWETAESRRKCKGQPNFCVFGTCSKDKITCQCQDDYEGRRCNYKKHFNHKEGKLSRYL